MSFCVNCGLEYAENAGHNFCASCGFALRKSTTPEQENSENRVAVVRQLSCLPDKKPIAGIVVALVVGIVGLFWSSAQLFHTLYGSPNSTQVALLQTFPSLQNETFLKLSFALIANTALIIGALMAYLNHPTGAKVVRVTAYSMIVITIASCVTTFFSITLAEAWRTLDVPIKGALIGGLVGGTIGAFLLCGLLLFLFREQARK